MLVLVVQAPAIVTGLVTTIKLFQINNLLDFHWTNVNRHSIICPGTCYKKLNREHFNRVILICLVTMVTLSGITFGTLSLLDLSLKMRLNWSTRFVFPSGDVLLIHAYMHEGIADDIKENVLVNDWKRHQGLIQQHDTVLQFFLWSAHFARGKLMACQSLQEAAL